MLDHYIHNLSNEDATIRYEAARQLGDAKDERGIQPLISALPDDNHKVQYAAFSALIKIGATEAAYPLVEMLLNDPDSQVWNLLKLNIGTRLRAGLLDMVARGDSALAVRLNDVLDSETLDETQRAYLMRLLGKTADTAAFDRLIATLADGNEIMRIAAAEALGWMGDTRAVPPLVVTLGDEMTHDTVRETAAEALGRIGDKAALLPLMEALHDGEEWVRRAAAVALGELGDAAALNVLGDALADESALVQDAAFEAIQKLSNQRYTTVL